MTIFEIGITPPPFPLAILSLFIGGGIGVIIAGYAFICLVFGTTFLAIKIGLNAGLPPLFMAAVRFGLAGLLLLPYFSYRKIRFPKTAREYAEIAWLGVLMTAIPFAALFWAEQYLASGMASLLVATSPAFIGIFGRLKRSQIAGLAVSFAGIALVVSPDLADGEQAWRNFAAMAAIVLSEGAFAYGVVRSKKMLAGDVSPQMFNGLQMLFASALLFAISLFTEGMPAAGALSVPSAASVLYLSVVASIAASGVYYWLVKMTNPMFPTTWTIVSPVVATIAGAVLLGETFTWIGAAGTVLTLAGIFLVNRDILGMFLREKNEQGSIGVGSSD
uniref:EamA family transporter n=1 Tax=Cohnella candidum TaxID=2674991 RepID=A0A3G3JSJ3_9BACL|nr:EamA family transporter [Cohnella candidum]